MKINRAIRAAKVRVIDADGNQAGILDIDDALKMADDANLDLVEIAPKANPPVCKIIDYSKFRYQQIKKEKTTKKSSHQVKVKEVKFKPNIPKEDNDRITEMLRSLTPEQPVATIENRILMPDGGTRWQQWSDRAIFDKHGNVSEYQSVGRDITEIKRNENAIKEANNKLNLLSSITRHDILNQLTVLLMLEEFLKKDITEEPTLTYVDAITEITNKIEEQILFTRDYQDLGQNKPGWQNLGKIANRTFMQSPGGNIVTDTDIKGIFVYADLMLEKVFHNLYDNAIRHGESVTRIHISFRNEESTGIITVEDDGTGVPADMKEKIFERHIGSNTGLGLFLVTEILRITGIAIRETGVPGKGCRFEIIIPEGDWRRETKIVPEIR